MKARNTANERTDRACLGVAPFPVSDQSLRRADNRLWLEMMGSRRHKYYRELMEQLRAEATKDLEGGEYVVPDAVRTRSESGSSDSGE